MVLFVQILTAQKTIKKSFNSTASKIIIEFDYIDEVEIISANSINKISIISNSENISSSNIIIEELNDKLLKVLIKILQVLILR